ncbi:unnamed protein product, partial [marine sediment metagenome]
MDISSYIKDLLLLHDCVIVPKFGGFVANYRAAEINYSNNTLSPPAKDISFNKSLVHNDGLLISYISKCKGIGYIDAKRIVSDFVTETQKKLEKGKKVTFDEIGLFYNDSQHNLQFEPDPSTNFLIDSFGLSFFQFSTIEDYDVSKRIQRKFKDKEAVKIFIKRQTVRRILIGIPLLLALSLIPLKIKYIENFRSDSFSLSPLNQKIKSEESNVDISQSQS